MPENEQFQYLKAYYKQLLPSLTEDNWKITEQVLKVRTYKKGELIVKEGQVCNNVSFINSGLVKMYFMVNGKEKIIGFCNELNYICDYQSFLTRKPANSYVQALENTEVVETSFDDLQMIYEKVPEANKLGRKIAEGLFLEMCEANHAEANSTGRVISENKVVTAKSTMPINRIVGFPPPKPNIPNPAMITHCDKELLICTAGTNLLRNCSIE